MRLLRTFEILALALCLACQAGTSRPGGKIVIEYLAPLADSVPVQVDSTPIRDAKLAPPRAVAPRIQACPHPWINAGRNSRLPGPVSLAPRAVRWQADLDPRFAPAFVTAEGDRILVQGEGYWQLFDLSGKLIATGRYGDGPVVMDAAHGLFYTIDTSGYIAALKLADGARAWVLPPTYGKTYEKRYLARAGDHLIIVEAQLPPRDAGQAEDSAVEIQRIPEPVEVDPRTGRLLSANDLGQLLLHSPHIVAAQHGAAITFAVPGTIFRTGFDLNPQAALQADFMPRWLSLDEAGRAYLVSDTALWAVAPDGRRFLTAEPGQRLIAPPILGYDHRVYLAANNRLTAVGAWSADLALAGAAVSSDDLLIASSGVTLLAFNAKGERTTLFTAPEPLVTPPAMSGGNLLVAGRRHLYCLK